MADTQIFGAGWFGSVAGSVVTPPVPLNFDGGETFLIDVTLGTSFPIVSTVKNSNNLVTQMTVTGTPTAGNGFCQALSAASASNIFTAIGAANAAAATGDIVMYTPQIRTQSIFYGGVNLILKAATYRSCSPVWKLLGQVLAGSGNSLEFVNLTVVEDMIINAARDQLIINDAGTKVASMRRCMYVGREIDINGAGTTFNIEHCLLVLTASSGGIFAKASSDTQVRHCFITASRSVIQTGGSLSFDNCIFTLHAGGLIHATGATGDWNWQTDAITLPGANSLTNKNLDDLKLAHAETEVNGFPTGPMVAWLPTPAASFGFTGNPPTAQGSSDAERRDFKGNLQPTTGNQTAGPINLETHDGGVAWTTYADLAGLATPNAPVITAAVPASGQVTVSVTGDAGKVHEVFYFLPGSNVPVSGGIRTGDGDIIITGLTNGITIVIIALTRASPTYGPPSLPVAATPVASASAPVGQIPSLVDRIRNFYLNSADFLSWIAAFDVGEVAADHVTLHYKPTDIKKLLDKGPVAIIQKSDHSTINAGQQNSYDGTLDIIINHIWGEDEDVKDDHMLAINKMAAIEKALLRLLPLEATFGSAVMTISGGAIVPFDEGDEQWMSTSIISLDWGPGE